MSELLSQGLGIEENINETELSRVKSNELFVFVERGKPGHLMKTFRSRVEKNKLNSHIALNLRRIERGQHRWKASALITAQNPALIKKQKTRPHLVPLSSTFPSHLRLTNLLSHSFVL